MEAWEYQLARRKYGNMTALDIYKIDKGICHVCNRPIDGSIPWPDPMCMSVDHVYDDTTMRLRASHLTCNIKRGEGATSSVTPPGTKRQSYLWRAGSAQYDMVRTAAVETGTSMNSVLNEAVRGYVASPQFRKKLTDTRAAQDEAIRKLAGED